MPVVAHPYRESSRDAQRVPWVARCPRCVYCVAYADVEAAYEALASHACPHPTTTRQEPLLQTFLPYADFERSAAVLDPSRLGKQRAECIQILKALTDPDYGWRNHPATKMWDGFVPALAAYGMVICEEWAGNRGYRDTCWSKIEAFYKAHYSPEDPLHGFQRYVLPPWFGDDAFHLSHQSNLIRKRPDIYADIFPGVPDNLEYVWPVS